MMLSPQLCAHRQWTSWWSAHLCWSSRSFKHPHSAFLRRKLSEERPHVLLNQFPCESLVTVKDCLASVARRVRGGPLPDWLPETFNLQTELPQFIKYFQQRQRRWDLHRRSPFEAEAVVFSRLNESVFQGGGQPLDLQALEFGAWTGHAHHQQPGLHHQAEREHPQGTTHTQVWIPTARLLRGLKMNDWVQHQKLLFIFHLKKGLPLENNTFSSCLSFDRVQYFSNIISCPDWTLSEEMQELNER